MSDTKPTERADQLTDNLATAAGPVPATIAAQAQQPLDRRIAGSMPVEKFGGLSITEYKEAVEFAKIMARSRYSIPEYLRDNVGDCLAIITQSLRWRIEPFWLAQHSYVAKPKDERSIIAYDAAVHAAIILSTANLDGLPDYQFTGADDALVCTVRAKLKGDPRVYEYESPPLARARPKRNEEGNIKGSPLWDKDPRQQLGYYSIRAWGRRHRPDLLAGVYSVDEFETVTQQPVETGASPRLIERLSGQMAGEGISETTVADGLAISDNGGEVDHGAEEEAGQATDLSEQSEGVSHETPIGPITGTPTKSHRRASREPKTEGAGSRQARRRVAPSPENSPVEAKPQPAATPEPGDPAYKPRNWKQYEAHIRAWLPTLDREDALVERFNWERKMRNDAGLISEEFDQARTLLRGRIDQLGKKGKK